MTTTRGLSGYKERNCFGLSRKGFTLAFPCTSCVSIIIKNQSVSISVKKYQANGSEEGGYQMKPTFLIQIQKEAIYRPFFIYSTGKMSVYTDMIYILKTNSGIGIKNSSLTIKTEVKDAIGLLLYSNKNETV